MLGFGVWEGGGEEGERDRWGEGGKGEREERGRARGKGETGSYRLLHDRELWGQESKNLNLTLLTFSAQCYILQLGFERNSEQWSRLGHCQAQAH